MNVCALMYGATGRDGGDVGQNMMQEDGSGGCEREEQEGGGTLQDDDRVLEFRP